MKPRLLVLSCSQKKLKHKDALPAIERYDGPTFRVLRRYLRLQKDSDLTVYILSAKFGLIRADEVIPFYDQELNKKRRGELNERLGQRWNELLSSKPWVSIGLSLGREYLAVLCGVTPESRMQKNISILQGGLGRRLTALRGWLNGE